MTCRRCRETVQDYEGALCWVCQVEIAAIAALLPCPVRALEGRGGVEYTPVAWFVPPLTLRGA